MGDYLSSIEFEVLITRPVITSAGHWEKLRDDLRVDLCRLANRYGITAVKASVRLDGEAGVGSLVPPTEEQPNG